MRPGPGGRSPGPGGASAPPDDHDLGMTAVRLVLATLLVTLVTSAGAGAAGTALYRIQRVVDGDTVDLTSGERVRLVQIDTPEVYPTAECYGPQASRATERLLPRGTVVRLAPEPATDLVDSYGRLLRYVIRAHDGVNVNLRLVAAGAAAPYFYRGRHGRYAATIVSLARHARAARLGLWGACPRTPYNPTAGVATLR